MADGPGFEKQYDSGLAFLGYAAPGHIAFKRQARKALGDIGGAAIDGKPQFFK